MRKMSRISAILFTLVMSFLLIISALAAGTRSVVVSDGSMANKRIEGEVKTKIDVAPVIVTYVEDEPTSDESDNSDVIVRDTEVGIVPVSANVSETLDLDVGESYSYGTFYIGAKTFEDSNAGDTIEVTVSAITSGKYKVIVKGIVIHSIFDTEEVYSYESSEYSTAKIFTLPSESGVAYTVIVVNTSAQNLKANVAVTYQS